METVIDHFLRYLRVERNASEHTIEAYRRDIDQFFLFACPDTDHIDKSIQSTDTLTIRLWLGTLMEEGLSRATIARKAAALRSFFKYAFRRGHIDQNPAQVLIIPKQSKRIPTVVSEPDLQRLLEQTSDGTSWMNQENAILELFYSTGIRLSELTSLNLEHLDLFQQQLLVMGKGKKQRMVPFGKKAYQALQIHLSTREELLSESDEESTQEYEALFLTKKGNRMYPRLVQKMVQGRINAVSEVNKKSPHVLRHSFATHMLNAGADIRLIKEFLGHSSLAATQVYTHTGVDHLKRIHQQAHPRAKRKD